MPKIFISYRRSASSGHAGRLYDRLITTFGEDNVFLDVEQIPAGETFSSYLLAQIDACDVFLLMLGEGTLDRTINEDDWVRREIAYALEHESLIVIPVLQDGYKMPPPDTLPEDIQDITVRNAAFLFHQMFDESVNKLIHSVQELFPSNSQAQTQAASEIPIRVVDPVVPSHADTQSTASGMGKIKIHRVGNMVLYRARQFTVKLDGMEVRQIVNNETIMLDVSTGKHTLSVHVDYHSPAQQVIINENETLTFEIHVRNMGLSVALEQV